MFNGIPVTKKRKKDGFAPQDNAISILPSILAGVILLAVLIFSILVLYPSLAFVQRDILILFGVSGTLYFSFAYLLLFRTPNKTAFAWGNALIVSISMAILSRYVPANLDEFLFTLVIIESILSSILSERLPAYFLAISFLILHALIDVDELQTYDWVIRTCFTFTALMGVETIQQLKSLAARQVNRLELINEVSKQITSTLETEQVLHLLNATFQNTIEADTYYIGFVDEEELDLKLFYDDGEYFNGTRTRLNGTLAGWVVGKQKELFLPDLRQDLDLEDVEVRIIGKNKPSLSWMGAPVSGSHVRGIMVVASYRPNAFDRSDLELLITIAQRAAHALDNAHHHALVESRARLDSLTGVLNHRHFIEAVEQQAEEALALNMPLTLIMLDIDFFKQYNDKFGHQTGDDVLVNLCKIIQGHIKDKDMVGRWGGEEFCVLLPNTNVEQAGKIANRIRDVLADLRLKNERHVDIPAPTVSQGIAVLPHETKDFNKLIDLADQRLFIAKGRGRDQIELPSEK